jgi:UDP-N-acetyl-D-mannosaminuronic acid transferase (WecB/TagA/CpsF family)
MIEVQFPRRLDVIGTPISPTSIEEVIGFLGEPRRDRATVVAVCNVHSVMSARRSVDLRTALDRADIGTPDGIPLVWAVRALYQVAQERVAGPDLMAQALARPDVGPHFIYGGSAATLDRLTAAISRDHPPAQIAGASAGSIGLREFRAMGPRVALVGGTALAVLNVDGAGQGLSVSAAILAAALAATKWLSQVAPARG